MIEGLTSMEMDFEVKTYDVDAGGHLNNIVYIRWLEELRNIYLDKYFDFKKEIEKGCYFVVVSTYIRYKQPLKLFDLVSGKISLIENNKGILRLGFDITSGKRMHARAEQKCVRVDIKTGKMV